MPSLEAQHLEAQLRSLYDPVAGGEPPDLDVLRAGAEQMAGLATAPAGVEVTEVDANGCPALMHRPEQASGDRIVMWTHGGASGWWTRVTSPRRSPSAVTAPELSTLLALRDAGRHAGAGILISPWTDLTLSAPAVSERAHRALHGRGLPGRP